MKMLKYSISLMKICEILFFYFCICYEYGSWYDVGKGIWLLGRYYIDCLEKLSLCM